MIFCLPDRKAGSELTGTVGEREANAEDTYLSIFERVFNEILQPFGKQVLKPSGEGFISGAKTNNQDDQHLYSTTNYGEGFEHPRLYFPFQSLKKVTVENSTEGECFDMNFSAYEPFYKARKASNKRVSLLRKRAKDDIMKYLERNGVDVEDKTTTETETLLGGSAPLALDPSGKMQRFTYCYIRSPL
ncbi:hypothetical protein LTR37_019814 [Vermiconidia calcicola]|uniref:Uncharacterized protein n=1 Tax=Vermiconidia calcicola TaxID=1690605 RepID=A0ACC3MD10_9PEZI|nr:hypothetical protein LTR37_019814 [Vermiconidia calcicola]